MIYIVQNLSTITIWDLSKLYTTSYVSMWVIPETVEDNSYFTNMRARISEIVTFDSSACMYAKGHIKLSMCY